MIVPVAVGVMNVAARAALAAVILLEKLSPHGEVLERLFGLALIAPAVVAAVHPEVIPGLHAEWARCNGGTGRVGRSVEGPRSKHRSVRQRVTTGLYQRKGGDDPGMLT